MALSILEFHAARFIAIRQDQAILWTSSQGITRRKDPSQGIAISAGSPRNGRGRRWDLRRQVNPSMWSPLPIFPETIVKASAF